MEEGKVMRGQRRVKLEGFQKKIVTGRILLTTQCERGQSCLQSFGFKWEECNL